MQTHMHIAATSTPVPHYRYELWFKRNLTKRGWGRIMSGSLRDIEFQHSIRQGHCNGIPNPPWEHEECDLKEGEVWFPATLRNHDGSVRPARNYRLKRVEV